MDESQRLRELAQRMIAASNLVNTRMDEGNSSMKPVLAGMELEMLKAEQA
jgi:hypothetical protein